MSCISIQYGLMHASLYMKRRRRRRKKSTSVAIKSNSTKLSSMCKQRKWTRYYTSTMVLFVGVICYLVRHWLSQIRDIYNCLCMLTKRSVGFYSENHQRDHSTLLDIILEPVLVPFKGYCSLDYGFECCPAWECVISMPNTGYVNHPAKYHMILWCQLRVKGSLVVLEFEPTALNHHFPKTYTTMFT